MNIIYRFINRYKFKKETKGTDQSTNVVDGMVKAKNLYKELSLLVHPDRNHDKRDVATELMEKVVANRRNYCELVKIKKEIEEKLKS